MGYSQLKIFTSCDIPTLCYFHHVKFPSCDVHTLWYQNVLFLPCDIATINTHTTSMWYSHHMILLLCDKIKEMPCGHGLQYNNIAHWKLRGNYHINVKKKRFTSSPLSSCTMSNGISINASPQSYFYGVLDQFYW